MEKTRRITRSTFNKERNEKLPLEFASDLARQKNSDQQRNLPLTLTTNTSTRAPNQIAMTSSVNSAYSAITSKITKVLCNMKSEKNSTFIDYTKPSTSKIISNESNSDVFREHSTTPILRASRSYSHSIYEEDSSGSEMFNPEDTMHKQKQNRYNTISSRQTFDCRQLPPPTEFGGCIGISILQFLSPILIYYLQYSCQTMDSATKRRKFKSTQFNSKSLMSDIFCGPAIGAYLTFIFGIFALSVIMPGRTVRLGSGATYKFTALPIAVLSIIIFVIAEYNEYQVAEFIIQHYGQFGIYGVLNSYVIALWLYIMNYKEGVTQNNIYGKTDNILIDYALGRQINLKFMNMIETKLIFYRIYLISTLLYSLALIYGTIQFAILHEGPYMSTLDVLWYIIGQMKYDTMSLISNVMLFLYIMDTVIYEHHLTFSFELQGEGFGCLLLLRYALSPYLLSAVSTYFFWHFNELKSNFVIYVTLLLFFIGLLLKRTSNSLKYKYRLNPNCPNFANVETIYTFQGRRLLLHSVWGIIRQPNYLGDMLALLAMCVPLTLSFHLAPFLSVCLLILILIHRCSRVNARNKARYHSSWTQYCTRVPYYLVPYVF